MTTYRVCTFSFFLDTQPGDSKREEFRKYLEKAGVLDALTKILVALYEEPEKPNDALDFLKAHMGQGGPDTADVESLRLQVSELMQKVERLQDENRELKAKVQMENPEVEPNPEN
ncbi:c-Myc-binding protein isoform X1 [Strongylocentrotus purpuratus]|uniref:c-Myc-binding protein n=1 Tax=Strongylocentrotus purpuratus TaxID=7668 RepID=A0A7M7PFG2_STRPU|nr:c-Myc-binding protein isoform X1 [Strongylocentrotus purpuratus]